MCARHRGVRQRAGRRIQCHALPCQNCIKGCFRPAHNGLYISLNCAICQPSPDAGSVFRIRDYATEAHPLAAEDPTLVAWVRCAMWGFAVPCILRQFESSAPRHKSTDHTLVAEKERECPRLARLSWRTRCQLVCEHTYGRRPMWSLAYNLDHECKAYDMWSTTPSELCNASMSVL